MFTTTPMKTKDSNEACAKTVFNRNKLLLGMVHTTSGKSNGAVTIQTGKLVKSLGVEERQQILKTAGISMELGEEELVAMKVDMGIPWEKLKTMSR